MPPQTKIQAFVARWAPRAELARLIVQHLAPRQVNVLDTIEASDLDDDELDEVTERVAEGCQSHASAAGTPQRYGVMAVDTDGRILAQMYARFAPEPGAELAMVDTEPETDRGALKQTLRHTEALMRMQLQTMGSSLGALVDINQRLMSRLATIEGTHLKHLELNEQLMCRVHERDLAAEELRLRQERNTRLLQTADAVGSAMVARMTGATDVTRLLQSLSGEHREMLFSVLDDEQAKVLHRIITLAQQDDRLAEVLGGLIGTVTDGGGAAAGANGANGASSSTGGGA